MHGSRPWPPPRRSPQLFRLQNERPGAIPAVLVAWTVLCQGMTVQAAEKLDSVKGTGFSPYISPAKSMRALAPEGRFSGLSLRNWPFSAACSVVPQALQNTRALAPEGSLFASVYPQTADIAFHLHIISIPRRTLEVGDRALEAPLHACSCQTSIPQCGTKSAKSPPKRPLSPYPRGLCSQVL